MSAEDDEYHIALEHLYGGAQNEIETLKLAVRGYEEDIVKQVKLRREAEELLAKTQKELAAVKSDLELALATLQKDAYDES